MTRRQYFGFLLAFCSALDVLCWRPAFAADAGVMSTMTVSQARDAALAGDVVLVDIRTPDEWAQSGVPDVAIALDMTRRGFIDKLLALRKEKPGAQLALICATGGRSHHLAGWLRRNGIIGVVDVPAGMHTKKGWLASKLPVKKTR